MKAAVGEQLETEDLARYVARALRSKRSVPPGKGVMWGQAPVEPAGHYCRACTAIAFQDDARCLYCELRRPAAGWATLESANEPWLGRIVGERYLITRRIARGAAARVYEAESLNIHRQFAIKIVDFGPQAATPNPDVVRARLGREIAAMSQLRNPHIVRIIEVLELSKDCTAMVMDYIRAPTLGCLLREQGVLGWPRACRIVRQIARATHAAHQAGMVHRDLKPANIMVEGIAGGDDFIHLLDFGIVWLNDGAAITNGFVGTPLYASPEQARGAAIDARSDIYSLGVIFFEMLVGHPPFQHARVKQVLRMHVHEAAPGLQACAPNHPLPAPLCRLVERMLRKRRSERPQDLLALMRALDDLVAAPRPRRPVIPRPCDLISNTALARPVDDASLGDSTHMGHGVLAIFSPSKTDIKSEIDLPVFVPKVDYERPYLR